MNRWTLLLLSLLMLLVPLVASADLTVERVRTDGDLSVDVRLDGAPGDGTMFQALATGETAPVTGIATPVAADLWLLVDSSTYCQAAKVDGYVNRLVRAVRRQAAPESRITLVTYTSESSDILLRDVPPAKLDEATIECEARPKSSSYDAPLARLLAEKKTSPRPLAVWVFTAGNLELSRGTAEALATRGAELDVVLYNAFIERDVRPMWNAAQAKLGGLPARLSVLTKPDGAVSFPSQRFTVDFPPKNEWLGRKTVLQLAAGGSSPKAPVLARTEVTVQLPLGGWAAFWRRYGRAILLSAAFLGFAFLVHCVVRYYRALRCERCERRISFRLQHCLFCETEATAFLVGSFRRKADGFGRGPLPTSVLPLASPVTSVGTHRKSVIHFPSTGRREIYFHIRREPSTRGPRYRLERKRFGRPVDLRVNGVPVNELRYLASGDEICVGQTAMVFRYGGETHAH